MRAQLVFSAFTVVALAVIPARAEDIPLPPPDHVRPVLALAGDVIVKNKAPGVAVDLRADAGIRWRALSVLGEFRYGFPEVITTDNGAYSLTIYQYSGALVTCGHVQWVGVCGVVQVTDSVLYGSKGLFFGNGNVASSLTFAFGPRVVGDIPLQFAEGRFALRLSVELLGQPHPVTSFVNDVEVWSTPGVAVSLGAGIVGDFWTK